MKGASLVEVGVQAYLPWLMHIKSIKQILDYPGTKADIRILMLAEDL